MSGENDVDMDAKSDRTRSPSPATKPGAKVVVVTNLTRNICEAHLHAVFGFYGSISKVDLPIYPKCTFRPHYPLFVLLILLSKLAKPEAKQLWNISPPNQQKKPWTIWMAVTSTVKPSKSSYLIFLYALHALAHHVLLVEEEA